MLRVLKVNPRFSVQPVDNPVLRVGTLAEFFKFKIGLCVDGITTSAHRAGRLLGYLQSRKRGCESLEREGRGIVGRGQSGRVGTPLSFPMPDCDGMAPQGKSARLLRDASPFALRITTGE